MRVRLVARADWRTKAECFARERKSFWGEARERHAVNALSAALADTDRRVRAEVCAALGAYREKRAQDELVRMSLSNDDRYVRTAALYALRRIADRASVNALHERAAAEKDPVIKSIIESMR